MLNFNVWSVFSIWQQRELARGSQPPAVKLHDFLNAMASAKACKQPGVDGVVVDVVRSLSWPTLSWLHLLFLVRLGGWETERPEAWRRVMLCEEVGVVKGVHLLSGEVRSVTAALNVVEEMQEEVQEVKDE